MKRKFILLTTVISFIFNAEVISQVLVQGRVLDQVTREPLIAVNISVEGSSIGTSTDEDGRFELQLPEELANNAMLQIRFIGYIQSDIRIKDPDEFLNIEMQPDNIALNEVRVIGFDTNKKLQETAGSVALVTNKDFDRTNRVSLQPVLNTIPGVRMDQSNLTDARISIRGGGIRSNFGIRNIKIYLNEIPLTEADGFTRIEGLDVATVGRLEVIKGPASSIYGAGTGGVLNFQTQRAGFRENSLEFSSLGGSHGLRRLATTYRYGSDSFNAHITFGDQNFDGFREHNSDERQFFTGTLRFIPSEQQSFTILLSRTSQDTYIPGSLTADQVQENPKQANARNLAQQAGRFQNWTRVGVAHTYQFNESFSNVSSAFGSFYDMDHPLAFAIIRQPYQSFGGRTRFNFEPAMKTLETKFTLGGEFLNGLQDSKRFQNLGGTEGDLIFNQELDMTQYSIFAQTETELTNKTSIEFGLSLNKVEYDVTDLLISGNSGVRDFDLEFSPRVALVHVFSDAIALRGGVSQGFSPPTANELRDVDGSIRNDVDPETGTNYEIGARGNLLGGLNYDVAVFHFRMKNQLIPQTVDLNNTIFVNAGRTNRNGFEGALSYTWAGDSGSLISRFRPFINYTYSDFEFRDFRIRNESGTVLNDFSGNDVTGISPHTISAGFDIDTNPGFYLNTTYFFTDDAPIRDDNSVFNPSYQVVNTKIGYRAPVLSSFEVDVQFGVDNLFDEKFSSNISLNATGFGGAQPAFFNPSLDRNAYVGVGIKYLFN